MKLQMLKRFLVSGVFLLSMSALANNNDLSSIEREGAEKKMQLINAARQKEDVALSFYGQVSDQYHEAVEGAVVDAQITYFVPDVDKLFGATKSLVLRTDSKGVFSIEGEKGRSIYIKSISKPGYDGALLTDQNRSFKYSEHGNRKPFVAEKKFPVSFSMRKQGATTFLLSTADWSFQISVNESGQTKGYDLVRATPVRDITRLVLNDEPLVCDLQMKTTFSTNNATRTVTLSPGNTNGGIIVSDQLLHEAPDTGYQPEYAFAVEDGKPLNAKYIYLKSRDPIIYSRLAIEYLTVAKTFVRLRGPSITNPHGDRNLEQAGDLPYEVTKQLTDEAKRAFRQNKRPEKPDLPKLIKEAKDKGKQ